MPALGLPCDMTTSTCGGRSELCHAQGPGADMMDSTRIIGQMQFEKAMVSAVHYYKTNDISCLETSGVYIYFKFCKTNLVSCEITHFNLIQTVI